MNVTSLRSTLFYITDYFDQPIIIVFLLAFAGVLATFIGASIAVKYDNLKVLNTC